MSITGANAQVLQWSNPTKIKGSAVFSKVIGENEKGIFLMRYRNRFYSKNIILERYSHLLALDQTKSIDLRNARLMKIVMTTNGILIIKSKYNRNTTLNDLSGQYYDFDLKAIGSPKQLASIPPKEFGDRGNFRLRVSDDLQLLSLIYTEQSPSKNIILHHKLLTIEQQLISSKNVELPFDYQKFLIQDFIVTNDSSVNFLCKTIVKERKKVVSYVHRLFHLKDTILHDFIIADKASLKSTKMIYDRINDQAIIVGFYGAEDQYGVIGTLFYQLNESRTEGIIKLGNFGEEFINNVKVNDRNDGALSEGYGIIEAIPRSDGGIMIIAEQKEIATEDDIILVNGIPQSTSKNIYNFNELLIINFDSSAFIDWHKVITKNQTTVNDGGYFSSVVVFIGDKFIQLLYNDQFRSSGDVMQYTIYNNGYEVSSKLLKTELDFVAIIPSESKQVSSNKLIVPTSKNRRFSLLKIVYN
ncbi:MAG: hypothetical protein COA58_04430 [Bacteroidetes bacterium]|nr:MAG: hypothetical protein COA58_04430 [Bacteroidota bacterium]